MKLFTYQPNLNDSRTVVLMAKAVDWTSRELSSGRPVQVHSTVLRDVFGTSKTGDWLRANLIRQTGHYQVGKHSFSYEQRPEGLAKLKQLLATATTQYMLPQVQTSVERLEERFKDELSNLEFNYTHKSDRNWHPLQNIQREKKQAFWTKAGLPFDYDINACAPTILIQLAEKLGLNHLVGQSIKNYIQNKAAVRARLANLAGCSVDDIKRVINSLFNGAALSRSPFTSTCRLLGRRGVEALQNDQEVRMLICAIKWMWKRIFGAYPQLRPCSKSKWAIYFYWETRVMDVVVAWLKANGYKFFTEHDGFRTNKRVDLAVLSKHLLNGAQLDINFSEQAPPHTPQAVYVATSPTTNDTGDHHVNQPSPPDADCSVPLPRTHQAARFGGNLRLLH